LHAQLRLDIEREHEAGFWSGAQLLHLENLPLMQATIEIALRVTGTSSPSNIRAPNARSKPTRSPDFFAVVLATRLFASSLKCSL
jgi:hypothetical protein